MISRHQSLWLILLVSFLGASLGAAVKIGIQSVPPLGFVAARAVLSVVFMLPLILKTHWLRLPQKLKLFSFVSLATTNITLFALGIGHTAVSTAAALYAATPLLSAVLSRFLYHQSLSLPQLAGIFTGLAGTSLIILTSQVSAGEFFSGTLTGSLIILAAVIAFSLYTALSPHLQQQFSPSVITQAFVINASVILLPVSIWEMTRTSFWLTTLSLKSGLSMIYVSLIGTVIFYFLYQSAIKHTSALVASLTMYLQPVFSIIIALPLFGERLTPQFIFGTLLTLLGVWLVTVTARADLYPKPKMW